MSKLKCEICNKLFNNLNALSAHVTKMHKQITQKQYYDKYILCSEKYSIICPTCGNVTKFVSIGKGYKRHCNRVCSNKDINIVKKRHETINKLYGGHSFCFKHVLEKCRQTIKEKYNVKNAFLIANVKEKANNQNAITKRYVTMHKNKSYKTSSLENVCYKELCIIFDENNIIRNYMSKDYPFKCDFYIISLDLYIECNFHWTHGGHWFDALNKDDLNKANKWKNIVLVLLII